MHVANEIIRDGGVSALRCCVTITPVHDELSAP
jgi:hypothetical protein